MRFLAPEGDRRPQETPRCGLLAVSIMEDEWDGLAPGRSGVERTGFQDSTGLAVPSGQPTSRSLIVSFI